MNPRTKIRNGTLRLVGNLIDEFGAGNLVILAFNDPDMAALRRRANGGDVGAFIRAKLKGKANR